MRVLLASLALTLSIPAIAEDTKPVAGLVIPAGAKEFARIETRERYVFTKVAVMEKHPDGIYIRFGTIDTPKTKRKDDKIVEDSTFLKDGGTTFLPYETLPDAVQKKLGGFVAGDARKAREQREADVDAGKPSRFLDFSDADDEFVPYSPEEDNKEFK